MTKAIESREDIQNLVEQFNTKVTVDKLRAPIFSHIDLQHHLPILNNFWSSVLLGEQSYRNNPFEKHQKLPIQRTLRTLATSFYANSRFTFYRRESNRSERQSQKYCSNFSTKIRIVTCAILSKKVKCTTVLQNFFCGMAKRHRAIRYKSGRLTFQRTSGFTLLSLADALLILKIVVTRFKLYNLEQ